MTVARIQRRFDQLATRAQEVAETLTTGSKQVPDSIQILGELTRTHSVKTFELDQKRFDQWRSSVESLLVQVFGRDFPHYVNFTRPFDGNAHQWFNYLNAVFNAAKEDYEGGYIFDIRLLVHAKVFADELEQADELLKQGYKSPAAVVAGVVLETTLKELCEQNGITVGKLNRMNADLAKAGVYNNARQDQVQAWSKIRNHAAHGESGEFNDNEVGNMIAGSRDFVANRMT